MAVKNIRIKSMVKSTVVLTVPHLNLRRTWAKKGAIQMISLENLEQAIFEPGVEFLFKSGLLFIDDLDTRVTLGLEQPGVTPDTVEIIELTDEYAKTLLQNTTLSEFQEKIKKLSISQVQELTSIAIELSITDYHRCEILKSATGKDVLKIVLRNKEEEAADQATS
jgi:hypothetical protein